MSQTDPQKREPHPNRCFWDVQTPLLPSDLAVNHLVEQIFSFFFFPTASHALEASAVTLTNWFLPISCKLFSQLICALSPNLVTYCTTLGNYSIGFCRNCIEFLLRVCWLTTPQALWIIPRFFTDSCNKALLEF